MVHLLLYQVSFGILYERPSTESLLLRVVEAASRRWTSNYMSAEQLIQYLSWALFLLVCASVMLQALRTPRRVTIDIALFFLIPALIIVISLEAVFGLVQPGPLLSAISTVLILAMAY
ncbi:MAG: hypothetical protein ABI901_18105, partial [Roseiflexaceae bacterium]